MAAIRRTVNHMGPELGLAPRLRRLVDSSTDPSVRAALIVITTATLTVPLFGGVADRALKDQELVESILWRELANIGAAIPSIGLFLLISVTHRGRPTTLGYLAWSSAVTVVVFGLVRFGLQLAFGITDFDERADFIVPESVRIPMFWLLLFIVRWMVTQRDLLVQAQQVIANEAHRALHDDHEALRSRVFDHLHGTVTSELVVARVRLNDIAADVADPVVRGRVLEVSGHIRRIHELEVRQLAHAMVASGLDASLDEAVHGLASSCEGLCDVTIRIDPAFADLDRELDADTRARMRLSAYRIIEECLSNALQHGNADHVDVSVRTRPVGRTSLVTIDVVNDGKVPESPPPPGAGLNVVRARAASHGGSVATAVRDGRFVVTAELCLHI